MCGLQENHLSTIKKNESATAETLLKIWEATNVNLHWLLTGEGELNRKTLKSYNETSALAERTTRRSRLARSTRVRAAPTVSNHPSPKRPRNA